MLRSSIWILTLSYWPRAAEAGVRPVIRHGYGGEDNVAFYRPHSFRFQNPPTRQEFLDMCKQLAWTATWETDLFPIIRNNHWPMIEVGYKASVVDLHDNVGRIVGRIEVNRDDLYYNSGSIVYSGFWQAQNRVLKRRPLASRPAIADLIRQNENWLREWVSRSNMTDTEDIINLYKKAIEQMLIKEGIMKGKTDNITYGMPPIINEK